MKTLRLLVALVFLSGCSVAPYNALLWNRENVEEQNGRVDTGPWFEWWYYKVVLPDTGEAFYFVYGVVNPWDTAAVEPASQAFVGFGHFTEHAQVRQAYPVSDFLASYATTDVRIQDQHATEQSITGTLVDADGSPVSWEVQIQRQWQFNAMGYAMFVPEITNIFWYPAQADARFTGHVNYKGRIYQFEDAPGYQDRNWGRTFPDWWAWIVANHFDGHPDTALAIGGGRPVVFNTIDCIEGVAIGLRHAGREYAFRPNEGDWERVTIDFGTWRVEAINGDGYRIEVKATAPCESFLDLVFTTPQNEQFHDLESLTGDVTVKLYRHTGPLIGAWQLIDTLHSDFAGIEYGSRNGAPGECLADTSKVLYANF